MIRDVLGEAAAAKLPPAPASIARCALGNWANELVAAGASLAVDSPIEAEGQRVPWRAVVVLAGGAKGVGRGATPEEALVAAAVAAKTGRAGE